MSGRREPADNDATAQGLPEALAAGEVFACSHPKPDQDPALARRFSDRPQAEICEMVGITLDDFTKSRAYQEIFGLGEARGEARGRTLKRIHQPSRGS